MKPLIVGAVTPISVETGMTMVAPTTVDTLEPTLGADARLNCDCEDDCDDCDDVETPILADLVIILKVLPLLKCMYKQEFFQEKVY
jgi:hypothetical protein